MNKIEFYDALKNKDINKMRLIPKTDLHNHSARGANRNYFEKKCNVQFPNVPKFTSIQEMDDWYDQTIGIYCSGGEGFKERIKGLFIQANNDNIIDFSPSFCFGMKKHFNNNFEEYFDFLKNIQLRYAPKVNFIPEISIYRNLDSEITFKDFEECLKYNFFKSIDLIGDENLGVDMYVDLYKLAKKHGLILKAHVGEFEGADYIEDAIEKLNLDVINHGINCVKSKNLMNEIAKRKIVCNICPTSNVFLSRVDSYKNHPIKEMVDNDIICTLNTDDMIIFNQSVSDEFLNLYNNGVLGAEELYQIKENGFQYSKKK